MQTTKTITDQELQLIIKNANELRSQELAKLVKLAAISVKSIFHNLVQRIEIIFHRSHSA